MTVRLIYVFDPLCRRCYGFAPAMRRIRGEFPDVPIWLRMGGLFTGSSMGPSADPAIMSSSVPPCDALLQVRDALPERVLDVAEALQAAHFAEGMDLNAPHTYELVMQRLGLSLALRIPAPQELSAKLADEFAESRALGFTDYPSLLLQTPGRLRPVHITSDPEAIAARIRLLLASA